MLDRTYLNDGNVSYLLLGERPLLGSEIIKYHSGQRPLFKTLLFKCAGILR